MGGVASISLLHSGNTGALKPLLWVKLKGMESAVVRTGVDNESAIRLYQAVGFRTVDRLYRYTKSMG